MRALIILAALVLLLAFAGWITFSNDPARTSINVETDKIREDTRQAMDQGAELLRDAEQEVAPQAPATTDR